MSVEGGPRVSQREINSLEAKPMPIQLAFGETAKITSRGMVITRKRSFGSSDGKPKRMSLDEKSQFVFGIGAEEAIPRLTQHNSLRRVAAVLQTDSSTLSRWIKKDRRQPRQRKNAAAIEIKAEKLFGKPAKEVVQDLYSVQQLSDGQIAEIFGLRNRFEVSEFRSRVGIPTRARKEALENYWKGLPKKERRARIRKMHSKPANLKRAESLTKFYAQHPEKRAAKSKSLKERREEIRRKRIAQMREAFQVSSDRGFKNRLERLYKKLGSIKKVSAWFSGRGSLVGEDFVRRVLIDSGITIKDSYLKRGKTKKSDRKVVLQARRNPDVFRKATKRQREVLRYRFPVEKDVDPLTQEETARIIGARNRQTVNDREQAVLRKFRKLLERKKQKAPVDK